jgi:riboflavin biosynthesis pyrimidine reductase
VRRAGLQAFAAGLVEEIYVHVAPTLLGGGVRLFDNIGNAAIRLKPVDVLHTPEVTHLEYRVLKHSA